ncbi:integrase domain-containing protein [Methylomicrobium agile]|uniref:integrase domain-containing protein n=1 Tax=Methylomicrobium agile TaxID=39774 RepID=UPI0004DF7147|nr:integrase domain-containing protein [Methylomicrobium agile]
MHHDQPKRSNRKNRPKSSRNYGIGSRSLLRAGKMCSHQADKSFSTKGTLADRWTLFAKWLQAECSISKMEAITQEHVLAYGRHLNQRVRMEELKPSSAQLYLSAVNSILKTATAGQWQSISPTRDCGIPRRKYLPETSKAMPPAKHAQVLAEITGSHDHQSGEQTKEPGHQRLAVLLDLQRTLGLRFKESALLDAKQALQQAETTGHISILSGTKGGKRREVPVSASAKSALVQAAQIQDGRSLIPQSMNYVQFRTACYALAQQYQFNFHAQRHHYAQQRYQQLTGAAAPITTGIPRKDWLDYLAKQLGMDTCTAEALDQQARLKLSAELGHNRLEVVSVYIG